jgi:hypothetical protein
VGCTFEPRESGTACYGAELSWDPVEGFPAYKVYVRQDADPYGEPLRVGWRDTGVDGRVHFEVPALPYGPTSYFSVSADTPWRTESVLSNELSIDQVAAAQVFDSDGDGLADAEEDRNLDGVVDAGETDPFDDDSDDDGWSDGDEVLRYGSDPLDSDSDGDGIDDGADDCLDVDGDGFGSPALPIVSCPEDNCVDVSNDQSDVDLDGLGDDCDPCPDSARNRCVGRVAVDEETGTLLRVNVGGFAQECAGARSDCAGALWSDDEGFAEVGAPTTCDAVGNDGFCTPFGIAGVFGCEDTATGDLVRCGRRSLDEGGVLTYEVSLPDAAYLLQLAFSSTDAAAPNPGDTVFDIRVNEAVVANDVDPVAIAGASENVLVRTAKVEARDGRLRFSIEADTGFAGLAAFEVLDLSCSDAADCDDGNPCSDDSCEADGVCSHVANSDVCGSGDACATARTCADFVCAGGTPVDCDDGVACTIDTCDAATGCEHTPICEPGRIGLDDNSLVGACGGSAGDSISVPGVAVGQQPGRILVVAVGGEEDDGDCDLAAAAASVTYAGMPMTLAVSEVSGVSSWRACNALFYLIDPPTGVAEVVVDFPQASATNLIDYRHAVAFVLYNTAGLAPESTATNFAPGKTVPVASSITTLTDGSWIVDVISNGNSGAFAPTSASQSERWQASCGTFSGALSTIEATAAGIWALGWTHSKPGRFAHSIAAFAPASE